MTLRLINPCDQSVLAELPYDQGAAVEAKVARAAQAFAAWRRVPLDERITRVQQGLQYFHEESEAIAREISLQMGKPVVQARREVDTFFERAEHMMAIAPEALKPDVLPKENFIRRIEHASLGVVLDIAAWNYPLLIPVNVVIPALLAGNAVLLKHSALTPWTGARFEKAFAGIVPQGLVTALVLDHAETERLVRDPRVSYVAFTGSVPGGQKIYQVASTRVLDVGLELGGKDPAYVAEDADLDLAVAGIVDGVCYNAGQSCCSIERVYVHERRYKDFLAKAEALMRGYRLGDPLEEQTTMGPLAQKSALDRLEGVVEETAKAGARVILGGKRLEGKGNFFPPTLVADVPQASRLMREESFGPICPVRAVRDDAEAMALMNDTDLGLTASVWTCDPARGERLAAEIDAGTVYMNRCDYLDPALPWTGTRHSGLGSTLSRYGFYALTRRKALHFRLR